MPFVLAVLWVEAWPVKPSANEIKLKDKIQDIPEFFDFL